MKKIILCITLFFISFLFIEVASVAAAGSITVETTARVPGAGCTGPDSDGVYQCRVGQGFTPVMLMVGRIIRYFTYIVALSAVLFIVINGILYSMAGIDQGLKDWAKKRITQTLLGLVVLLLSGVILNAVAPWIYTL